jgi:hypothetical protein
VALHHGDYPDMAPRFPVGEPGGPIMGGGGGRFTVEPHRAGGLALGGGSALAVRGYNDTESK